MILGDVIGWSPASGDTERVTYGVIYKSRRSYVIEYVAVKLKDTTIDGMIPTMHIGKNRWHVLPRHFLKQGEYRDAEG